MAEHQTAIRREPVTFPTAHPRAEILGVEVDLIPTDELVDVILGEAQRPGPSIVANHNLNSVRLFHDDIRFAAFYRDATAIHIDGMSLVWAGRLGGVQVERRHRSGYMDLLDDVLRRAEADGLRVFYLGTSPEILEQGLACWRERHPRLDLAGHHGYFDIDDPSANEAVLRRIADHDPHILFVGMGMPRQERWIHDNHHRIPARVVLPAGGCIDYTAGAKPLPPRWLGRLSLEWAYRLITEPRRLWRRYLLEPWAVLPILLRSVVGRMRP